jgi:hypothetical protein
MDRSNCEPLYKMRSVHILSDVLWNRTPGAVLTCPGRYPHLLTRVIVIRSDVVFVRWPEQYRPLCVSRERCPSADRMLELGRKL